MDSEFAKKWGKSDKPLPTRIKKTVKSFNRLRQRLNFAVKQLELQIRRLNEGLERFSKRDKMVFNRIVESYSKRNMLRATTLANELAEIRKIEKLLMRSKLALESVCLRLKTISEFGEVISVLAPSVKVLDNVRSGISNVFPQVESELGDVGKMLNEIVTSTSHETGTHVNLETASEDAKKILEEAEAISMQRAEEMPLPPELSAKEKIELKK